MTEQPFVVAIVIATDPVDGSERIFRYYYSGEDHGEAARAAFKALGDGSRIRVRDIETYVGPPRWWDPMFEAKERT